MKAPEEPHEISQRAAGWPHPALVYSAELYKLFHSNFSNYFSHVTKDLSRLKYMLHMLEGIMQNPFKTHTLLTLSKQNLRQQLDLFWKGVK